MVRFQSFILFSIFIALPNGTSTSELDGGATSSSSRRQDDDDGRRHRPASTMTTTTTTVRILDELYMKVKNTIDATNSSDISSSTPTTATNSTTSAPGAVNPPPTPITTPAPTPSSPTFPPTKKYEPDDEEKKEEEKEQQQKKGQPSIGMIFLWTIVTFALLWMSCYFSDAIIFFFGNIWINTRRYGCQRGCLQPLCPCVFGRSLPGPNGGGVATLDEIIFESEDGRTPLIT